MIRGSVRGHWCIGLAKLLVLGASNALAQPGAERLVKACDDTNEWPPYTFRVPMAAGGTEVQGRSVDVLRRALARMGWSVQIDLLPWNRCLAEVASGRYHLVISATLTAEREQNFWATEPYYQTHTYYVWSLRHHPSGLGVERPHDFAKWRVGGVQGYQYPTLKAGGTAPQFWANNHPNLMAMMQAGRIDTVLMADAVLRTQRDTNGVRFWDDASLGRAPAPGAPVTPYRMLISKRWVPGKALATGLDAELTRMRQKGELAALMEDR